MAELSDLELVKACAERMGYRTKIEPSPLSADDLLTVKIDSEWTHLYRPLTDDAQCLALIKRFPQQCINAMYSAMNYAMATNEPIPDLNRCVVECVSKLPYPALTS